MIRRLGWLCGALLIGCTVTQNVQPSDAPIILQPQLTTPTAAASSPGWEAVGPGLEYRELKLQANGHQATFATVRLDPTQYRLRVAYDRTAPGTIREWVEAIKPVALINGGYFDENKRATALVIFDGVPQGESYDGFGGMVVVNPNGDFELRSLRQQPYDPDEGLQQAMQSTPMLIQPGGTVSELDVDNDVSRRSVVARDTTGRILLMVSNWPVFTLSDLAEALKNSDLELDAALNLDGGRSSGLFLDRPNKPVLIEAFDRLPLVLVVDQR